MASVVTLDPIKDSRWDHFVLNHPFGWICHHSGWKEVLENSFAHMKGHYLAAVNENGEIKAGLPLFEVRSWLTGNRLVSIPFATLSDPLIDGNGDSHQLIEASIGLSRQVRIPRVELRSLYSQNLIDDCRFSKSCFFKHHYLELSMAPDELRNTFHYKAVRYEINRAQRSGLALKVASNEEDLQLFYALYAKTRGRLGLPPQPYRFFESIWNVFWPLGMVTLLLATHNDDLIAGQLYFKFRSRVSMEFEAWDRQRRSFAPNHFLIWEAIRLFHLEGFRTLDFGRTSVNNPSLMDFKRRWGTRVIDLPQFCYPVDVRSDGDREDSTKYKFVRKLCQKSPTAALDLIGRFCYRHLG